MLHWTDDSDFISFLKYIRWAANALAHELVVAAPRHVQPSIFLSDRQLEVSGHHSPSPWSSGDRQKHVIRRGYIWYTCEFIIH